MLLLIIFVNFDRYIPVDHRLSVPISLEIECFPRGSTCVSFFQQPVSRRHPLLPPPLCWSHSPEGFESSRSPCWAEPSRASKLCHAAVAPQVRGRAFRGEERTLPAVSNIPEVRVVSFLSGVFLLRPVRLFQLRWPCPGEPSRTLSRAALDADTERPTGPKPSEGSFCSPLAFRRRLNVTLDFPATFQSRASW